MHHQKKAGSFLALILMCIHQSLYAQNNDQVISCRGRVEQDQRRLILLNLNFKLGGLLIDGDLNGDPIVASNFGTGNSIQVVGFPKSQDTGNTRDIVHKMTVNINKSTGIFNMTIVGANGHTYYLTGGGECLFR